MFIALGKRVLSLQRSEMFSATTTFGSAGAGLLGVMSNTINIGSLRDRPRYLARAMVRVGQGATHKVINDSRGFCDSQRATYRRLKDS